MVFKDILLIFVTERSLLFYETRFTRRQLLFLHNFCVYSL